MAFSCTEYPAMHAAEMTARTSPMVLGVCSLLLELSSAASTSAMPPKLRRAHANLSSENPSERKTTERKSVKTEAVVEISVTFATEVPVPHV